MNVTVLPLKAPYGAPFEELLWIRGSDTTGWHIAQLISSASDYEGGRTPYVEATCRSLLVTPVERMTGKVPFVRCAKCMYSGWADGFRSPLPASYGFPERVRTVA